MWSFLLLKENNVENMMKKSDAFERVIAVRPSPNVIRCVLFIGPRNVGRNELKSRLLNAFPEKYGNVVPHTTRRPRYEAKYRNFYRIKHQFLHMKWRCLEKDSFLKFPLSKI